MRVPLLPWSHTIIRSIGKKSPGPKETRFSRSTAYYGEDKLELKPSVSQFAPSYYDTNAFALKRFYMAAASIAVFFAYFGYFREPNDIDQILNTPQHVLAGNLERKLIREQMELAKNTGQPLDYLQAQLDYVDVKEAAVKATYDKKKHM